MDLNAIQMFVAVAQMGSLSAAALHLDMPLQTLSRRIRELEHELNVQLLQRSMRGTKLTQAGENSMRMQALAWKPSPRENQP